MTTPPPPATGGPWTLCAAHLAYGKFYLGEPSTHPVANLGASVPTHVCVGSARVSLYGLPLAPDKRFFRALASFRCLACIA